MLLYIIMAGWQPTAFLFSIHGSYTAPVFHSPPQILIARRLDLFVALAAVKLFHYHYFLSFFSDHVLVSLYEKKNSHSVK